MTANRFAVAYGAGFEARAIEAARGALADIPACARADYAVRFIGGAPVLTIAFSEPESVRQLHQAGANGTYGSLGELRAMVAVRLVSVPAGEPLRPGMPLEGDRLRRHVRQSVEHYLLKNGVALPSIEP